MKLDIATRGKVLKNVPQKWRGKGIAPRYARYRGSRVPRGEESACGMRHSVGFAALLPYSFRTKQKNRSQGSVFLFGGGSWIRTSEVSDNRFTVCPLWPLGNSPLQLELVIGVEPTTCWLQISCSAIEPHQRHNALYYSRIICVCQDFFKKNFKNFSFDL